MNLLLPAVQFSVLGVGCAGAAVLLYEGVRVSEVVLRPLPRWVSAPLGGAVCGLIAFKFPQVSCQAKFECCSVTSGV
jgi:H+/Cl- antiporter ClcA